MSAALDGKKVLITREKRQAKEFSEKVLNDGGIPIEVPMLKVSCQQHAENEAIFRAIEDLEWIFFTSANDVDCFFLLAGEYGLLTDKMSVVRIAAVGHKTQRNLQRYALRTDLILSVY